jgi:DNA-binding GntR family transcriptional regulator
VVELPPSSEEQEPIEAQISRLIIEGEFGPGDRLKLSDLARRFGVSQMPVREALWKLEGSGLVRNLPNRGAVVRNVDEQHIENVYELRAAIEMMLIERVVVRVTSSDLEQIEVARVAVEASVEKGERSAILAADQAFHNTINQIAGNDLAMATLARSMPLIQSMRLRVGFSPLRLKEMLSEHEGIVAAIREGDGRLAAQRVRLHMIGARRAMIATLEALRSTATGKRRSAPGHP